MTTRSRLSLNPWSRAAVEAAGLNSFELLGRIPVAWHVHGWADSARGAFHFSARRRADGTLHTVSAYGFRDIADALERLFVLIAEDDLEGQLAASLEAIR